MKTSEPSFEENCVVLNFTDNILMENFLNRQKEREDFYYLNLSIHKPDDLFGYVEESSKEWVTGLFTNIIIECLKKRIQINLLF